MTHTPGTWKMDGDGFDSVSAVDYGCDGYTVFSVDDEGCLLDNICQIDETTEPDQAEANAHLIVAAPELLEALEMCVEYVEDRPIARIVVQNAIAKAKGQDQ